MHSGLLAAAAAAKQVAETWDQFWKSGWGILVMVLIIVAVATGLRTVALVVIRIFVDRIVSGAKKRQGVDSTQALIASPVTAARIVQRTRTLGSVLSNIVTVVVVVVALLLIITTINPNITGAFSLITAALGAGLGFGAQNIIKDVLTGLFMVTDDQLGVGDVVTTDLASGVVEAVGIRVTQIRDVNGVLWYVRNGELTRVGNLSQGWSRAILDVTVPRDADADLVQHRLLDTATDLAADPKWAPYILEPPALWGLESISADGIVLRIVVKTRSASRDDVAWALRVHAKEALDALGVSGVLLATPAIGTFEVAGPLRGVRPPRTEPTPTPRRQRARATRPPAPAAPTPPAADSAAEAAEPADARSTATLRIDPLPANDTATRPIDSQSAGARGRAGASGRRGTPGASAPEDRTDGS